MPIIIFVTWNVILRITNENSMKNKKCFRLELLHCRTMKNSSAETNSRVSINEPANDTFYNIL